VRYLAGVMRGRRGRLDRQAANKQHAENSQDELSHFGLQIRSKANHVKRPLATI
jgi:hypothetical protein